MPEPSHPVPADAPHALVHAPTHFDAAKPLHLVVFLHGWRGCARALALAGRVRCRERGATRQGWNLTTLHDAAGTTTLFVVPQLAFNQRSSSPGRFRRPGYARCYIRQILQALTDKGRLRRSARQTFPRLTLVAHSAGYRTAAAWLDQGDVASVVQTVVLLDALYDQPRSFSRWLIGARRRRRSGQLLTLFLPSGKTARQSQRLAQIVAYELGQDAVARSALPLNSQSPLVLMPAAPPHATMPQRYLSALLSALDVRPKEP